MKLKDTKLYITQNFILNLFLLKIFDIIKKVKLNTIINIFEID